MPVIAGERPSMPARPARPRARPNATLPLLLFMPAVVFVVAAVLVVPPLSDTRLISSQARDNVLLSAARKRGPGRALGRLASGSRAIPRQQAELIQYKHDRADEQEQHEQKAQIGRASCRERV